MTIPTKMEKPVFIVTGELPAVWAKRNSPSNQTGE
jgi:hypothetical protein